MSAILVAHTKVKNLDKLMEYAKAVYKTLEPFGVEFIYRGKVADVLVGEHAPEMAAIIRFPDYAVLKEWFYSPAYNALVPIRDEGAEMTFVAFDDDASGVTNLPPVKR